MEYLLTNFLDMLPFCSEFKAKVREIFATWMSYRTLLRPIGKSKPHLLWLADYSGQYYRLVVDLVENTVFDVNSECEAAIRLGVKYGRSPKDLLENYSPFKEKLERIQKLIKQEEDEKKAAEEAKKLEEKKLQEDVAKEDGAANPENCQDDENLVDDGEGIEQEYNSMWKSHAKQQLSFFCNMVVWTEDMKAGDLVELLQRDAPATCRTDTGGNTLILCDMNVWGAVSSRPYIRKSPLTAEQLTTAYSAVLQCRGVDLDARVTYLPVGDCFVFADGGIKRDSVFKRALQLKENAAKAKDGRTMFRVASAIKEQKSLEDRYERVKIHAEIKTTETVITAFNGKTKRPRRDRLKGDGTNQSDFIGRFELPPLTTLASLTRPEWEEFWDWRLKNYGTRAGDSESDEDSDEENKQELSKHNSIMIDYLVSLWFLSMQL